MLRDEQAMAALKFFASQLEGGRRLFAIKSPIKSSSLSAREARRG